MIKKTGSFAAFKEEELVLGYDEVLVREWAPDIVLASHAHPFDANA